MWNRIVYVVGLLVFLTACVGSTGEYRTEASDLLKKCETTNRQLLALDTAEMVRLMQDARMNMIDFKTNLKSDTLDLETARELDDFVRAYKLCKSFQSSWIQAKMANDTLKKRVELLLKDIEAGAGDRSGYALGIRKETKEWKAIHNHTAYLDSINHAFIVSYKQFKPIFERYLREENS
jgi:hypothetical protein